MKQMYHLLDSLKGGGSHKDNKVLKIFKQIQENLVYL